MFLSKIYFNFFFLNAKMSKEKSSNLYQYLLTSVYILLNGQLLMLPTLTSKEESL